MHVTGEKIEERAPVVVYSPSMSTNVCASASGSQAAGMAAETVIVDQVVCGMAVLFFATRTTVQHRPDGGLMSDKHSQVMLTHLIKHSRPEADSRLSHPDKYHRPVQSPGKLLRQLCMLSRMTRVERQECVDSSTLLTNRNARFGFRLPGDIKEISKRITVSSPLPQFAHRIMSFDNRNYHQLLTYLSPLINSVGQ